MEDVSSDSEVFASDSGRYRGRSRKFIPERTPSKVDKLASSLEDTNRNLRAVDQLLTEYKDIGQRQNGVMDKLRHDIDHTTDRLREEKERRASMRDSMRSLRPSDLEANYDRRGRRPTSPLRNYERSLSDREYTGFPDRRRARSGDRVRFHGDDLEPEDHLHELHQSVRDLTSGQLRLEDDFNREITRRNRFENDSKKSHRETSDRKQETEVMVNVDKRLQSIQDELRAERQMLRKKQDEAGSISTELKQALSQQQKQQSVPATAQSSALTVGEESELRSRLSQSEAHREQIGHDLMKLKRQIDQSEGGRNALLEQIDDLRRQMARSDQEKMKMKSLLQEQDAELRDLKRRTDVEISSKDQIEDEKRRLQDSVRDLQSQLSRSSGAVADLGDVRKELDRSERQRTQLSDHIEVLNKEMETKEKFSAKIITQLQEVSDKYETCEKQRHETLLQLEDTLKRYQEATKEAERVNAELRETKQGLTESELKREDIKNRAQDTVKQWKLKCKKLERDLDRQTHSGHQAVERNEQLVKELEATRNQSAVGGQQMEHFRHQLSETLAVRAQQDEQLRIRDIEVNELKSLKMDLEKEVQDNKIVIAKMEQELHAESNKYAAIYEEKDRLEDQINQARQGHYMAEQQMSHMQREMQELSLAKVELSAQLADMAQQRQELKESLSESRKSESGAREDIEGLVKKLREEKEFFQSRMDSSKAEIDQIKGKDSQMIQEMSRRYKRERAEYEAELQALKIELTDERSSSKLTKKQNEKLKEELDRLHQEIIQAQEDSAEVQRNYKKVKEEFLTKAQLTEDDLTRARELELQLFDTREEISKVTKDYQNTLRSIGAEIEAMTKMISKETFDAFLTYSSSRLLHTDPQKWLVDIQSKLSVIKRELEEKLRQEEKLKHNVNSVIEETEKDREFYISEISRQNDVLDMLASQSKDIAERDTEKSEQVSRLQGQLENLTAEKEDAVYKSMVLENDRENLMDDLSIAKESQKERERIHERYAKLQETMSCLKQDLAATRLAAVIPCKDSRMKSPNGSPDLRRKVHIASPPIQTTPSKHLNGILKSPKTPPPLNMTDEEFKQKFIPHTPTADDLDESV